MEQTPNLRLPYLMAAQAQKHVTHNEAIRALDCLVQLAVLDRDLTNPPASPANGARYIVPASPTGAWSGQAGKIAAFQDGAWQFYSPQEGWVAWVADEDILVVWNGSAWVTAGGGGGVSSLNPATGGLVGINATADTSNRLAVASPNTLFSHDGSDHRLKINKAAATNTASVLFQTAFSGRAEFGLAGDDDWHVKVSPDGSTWYEALVVDRTNGRVRLPLTPQREVLSAARTYYVRTDGNDSNTGLSNSAGGAFRTIQKAVDTVASLDLSIYDVTIQVADGTYEEEVTLKTLVGAGRVTILGDESNPANVVVQCSGSTSDDVCFMANGIVGNWRLSGLKVQADTGSGNRLVVVNGTGTRLTIQHMEFGLAGNSHINVTNGAACTISGPYKISGNVNYHINLLQGSIDCFSQTVTLTGTPNFSTSFILCTRLSYARINANTYSGSATGTRYTSSANSVIFTNGAGATYLPGSVDGTTASGGLYV